MKQKETYQVKVSCSNCCHIQKKPINIPKGTKWHVHTDELKLECEYCGCVANMNISYFGEVKI